MQEKFAPSAARPSNWPATAEVLDKPGPDFRAIEVFGRVAAAVVFVQGNIAVGVALPTPLQKGPYRVIRGPGEATFAELPCKVTSAQRRSEGDCLSCRLVFLVVVGLGGLSGSKGRLWRLQQQSPDR